MRRRKARELALQVLFALEIDPKPATIAISELKEICPADFKEERLDGEFFQRLVVETEQRRSELDQLIEDKSQNWKLSRMTRVDRNILRLAAAELIGFDDVPASVTLDEAIQLAKRFGTEDSPPFINGLLDQFWKSLPKNPHKAANS